MSLLTLNRISLAINEAMVECVCTEQRPLSLLTTDCERAQIQPFIYNAIQG
ncbi:MAG: hypothetical protein ACJ8GO_16340 [Ramlibacter sp.]